MIAHLQGRHAQAAYRRHAGCSRDTALPSFHGRKPFFEGPRRGVCKARVNIAWLRPGKPCGGLGGIFKYEA